MLGINVACHPLVTLSGEAFGFVSEMCTYTVCTYSAWRGVKVYMGGVSWLNLCSV